MSVPMDPSTEYVRKWLIKANNDLRVVENEMKLSLKETVAGAVGDARGAAELREGGEAVFHRAVFQQLPDRSYGRGLDEGLPDNQRRRIWEDA